MLTHMIVISGTEVNLDDNELRFLTSLNLRLLRPTSQASAAAITATDLSIETITTRLHQLIESEIKVHDELDFDMDMFRAFKLTSSSAVLRPSEAPVLKTASMIGNDSSTSLTTTESLSPFEPRSNDASVSLQARLDQGLSGQKMQAKRRYVKVRSLPRSTTTESSLALLAWTRDLVFSETRLAASDAPASSASSDMPTVQHKRKESVFNDVDNHHADARIAASSFDRQTTSSFAQILSLSPVAFPTFRAKREKTEAVEQPDLSSSRQEPFEDSGFSLT